MSWDISIKELNSLIFSFLDDKSLIALCLVSWQLNHLVFDNCPRLSTDLAALHLPLTDKWEDVKNAVYTQTIWAHLQFERNNNEEGFAAKLKMINAAYEHLDTQDKLNEHISVTKINSILKYNKPFNFFVRKTSEVANVYISLPFQCGTHKSLDIISLPKLNISAPLFESTLDLDYFAQVLNNTSTKEPIMAGVSLEEVIELKNQHSFRNAQLIMCLSVPKYFLSNHKISEYELDKQLNNGNQPINAAKTPCFWIIMNSTFIAENFLAVFPMELSSYSNSCKFNLKTIEGCWPINYRYEINRPILSLN